MSAEASSRLVPIQSQFSKDLFMFINIDGAFVTVMNSDVEHDSHFISQELLQ